MKKALIVFLLCNVFQAQAKYKFDVYAEAGVSKSVSFGFYGYTDFRKINLPFVGLKCRGHLNPFVIYETGLQLIPMHDYYYSQSSRFYSFYNETITSIYQKKSELTKLSVPLTLHYQFKKLKLKPEFSVGLIYNRVLSASFIETTNIRSSLSSKRDINDTFALDPLDKSFYKPLRKNFFQFQFGIGAQLSKNFRMSLNVYHSITGDAEVVPDNPKGWYCFVPRAMFNRNEILLSLMYKIN